MTASEMYYFAFAAFLNEPIPETPPIRMPFIASQRVHPVNPVSVAQAFQRRTSAHFPKMLSTSRMWSVPRFLRTASLVYGLDEKTRTDATDLKLEFTLTRISETGHKSNEFAPTLRMAPERTASIRVSADDKRELSVNVDGSIGQSLVRIRGELTDGNGKREFVPTIEMRIGTKATLKLDRLDGTSLEFAVTVNDGGSLNN